MISMRYLPLGCLVAMLTLLSVGCSCNSEPVIAEPQPPHGNGTPVAEPSAVAKTPTWPLLIGLYETNLDTFAEPQIFPSEPASERENPPLAWVDGIVELNPELRDSRDADQLAEAALTLGDPKTPLAKCRVLVVHVVAYGGIGREGETRRYYAFPDFPVEVPLANLPDGQHDAEFVFDPATSAVPLPSALREVRLLGNAESVTIESVEQNRFKVALNQTTHELGRGESATLLSAHRSIKVRELSLSRKAVTFIGPPPDPAIQELEPGVDYGPIKFSTELVVRVHGPATEPIPGPTDLSPLPEEDLQ